jgi:CRISP-associated protein Cas1
MESLSATDDHEWADRSRHWAHRITRSKDKRVRRQPSHSPLILAGHGVSLRIEAGTLLVRNGFTHYPQKQQAYRFFKGDADFRRGSSCWTAVAASPSTSDWNGNAVTVISGDSFAANRYRVAWQTATRSDPRKRMEFCNALITRKIEGCVQTLEGFAPSLPCMG